MSELSDRLRDYSHKSAVMAHYHTRNGLRDDADYWSAHAADMLAAAELLESRAPVQASEARGDWVLVPREPTEEMLEAGRSAVMARDCSGPKWGPADHYRAAGIDRTGIPDRLFEGRQKMSKAWCAELVYATMIAAHTQAGPVD